MYNFWYGVQNIFRWIPIIWGDRDWDWYFLAKIMQYKLRRMSKVFENGHHTTAWKDARTTLICAELLKRLSDDNYFENAGYNKGDWCTRSNEEHSRIINHSIKQAKQDEEYLGKIFGRNLRGWWD